MIEFKPLQSRNGDWVFQPDFYLHGSIAKDTDLVVMNTDVFSNKVSRCYLEGQALPSTFIDIPEGRHLCSVNGITCVLYTWKCIIFSKDGWTVTSNYNGPVDVWLRQLGLIVAINDEKYIEDAEQKFNNKSYII